MSRASEADRAKALLVNYFHAIAKKAGMPWDSDYTAEIEEAVDHIIDAAACQARDDLTDLIKPEAML